MQAPPDASSAAGGGAPTAVVSAEGGAAVCERCELADSPLTRLRGLLGRRGLEPGSGLLLRPSNSIHTFFMRFPIDAVFLDAELRVVSVRSGLRPWRAAAARGARAVLELPAGEAERRGVEAGQRLSLSGGEGEAAGEPRAAREPIPWPTGSYAAGAVGIGVALCIAALVHFGLDARGLLSLVFVAGLVVLAAIDLERRLIPNRIVLPLAAFVLAWQLAFFPGRALEWIAAAAGAAVLLGIPAFFRPGSVGMGDVKLAFLIGAGLGRAVITALFLGSLAAVPVALWILARRGMEARHDTIPLGPFLAAGAILALFVATSL